MMKRPFLTYFARERKNSVPKIELYYNEELEMNLPVSVDDISYGTICGTRTFTEVKTEQPDKDVNDDLSIFYSTKTFTKIKTEQPDKDVSEW